MHIEPFENELKVRYRIDGMLHEQKPPPKHLQRTDRPDQDHVRDEHRRTVRPPGRQDRTAFEGRKVDIRVSTVPTLYGESVVMRILDKSSLTLDLSTLGMRDELVGTMDSLLEKPHGMVLVTGPTGSGKTTTLYASLTRLYDPHKKIITIEDPVEYELSGINQIPVNPKRGLTFASGLRSILRQDPDVVLVGEIRDNETADIAIRSALTGHLILSTLHTNDAISSIGRLVDMDAEPFLVASVLEGLLAQRLGRRICQHCREQIPPEEDMAQRLRTDERELFGGRAWRGAGCEKCNNTGYLGRLGYFELLRINPAMRAAISTSASQSELREAAGDDFSLMRQDGILRAVEGETTIEEVLRATQDSDEMVT